MKKQKKVLAIDIGTTALKMAIVDISGAKIKLLKANLVELPESVSLDKNGFIKTSIQNFLEGNLSVKQVYVALSFPYVEIERVDLPNMPLNEISEAVKWKLKDKLPFSIEESIIDSAVADEYATAEGAKELVVMTASAQRKEINSILSVLQDLHLVPVSIGVVPFGLSNLLEYMKDVNPEESISIVEIGANHTYISIYKSNKLMFTRNIPVFSSQITDSMCGVLVSDKGRIELGKESAEDIKRRFGMPLSSENILDNKIPASHISAMVRPILERLASEIKRTFNYYISELKGVKPDKIYLTGGGARLKNLDKFIKEELKVDIQYLGLPEKIENETEEDSQSILSFLGLISTVLPLQGMKVNLLPPEIAVEKVETIKKASIRMVGFTVLSILVLLYFGATIRVAGYKKRLESAKSQRNILQKVINYHNRLIQFNEAVQTIKREDVSCELLFKEISSIIPDNIVLNELSFNIDTKEIIFKGIIYPKSPVVEDELTRFMEGIENSNYFKDANLVSVEKDQTGGKLIANFEIKCGII